MRFNSTIFLAGLVMFFDMATYCQLPAGKQVYVITSFGATGDGTTINTQTIQKAIDECHNHGGGMIDIPPGDFVTGTLRLYSDMELYFEPGAVLTGSKDIKDYGEQKDRGFTGLGAGNKTGILVAHGEKNISLSGYGTIRGVDSSFMYMDSLQYGSDLDKKYTRQGKDYMDPIFGREDGPVLWKGIYEDRPGVMVIFSSCKNITVSKVKLEQSPNWTIAFLNSQNIKVDGITINNNLKVPNSDGLDFYDSKDITISNCNIHAGDDAIAVVSSSNMTVTNCILQSRSSGIRVGYNVYNHNNSGNLLFDNIRIYDSNRGIGIFQRQQGDMENMIFSNIIISTRLHTGQWWGHGEPIHISCVPGLGNKETGAIRHVHFSNIIATSESGILIYASSNKLIEDISFDNTRLTIKKSLLEQGYGGNFDLRPSTDLSLGIFKHTIPAFYANHVDDLSVRNLEVNWDKGLPDYFTHAIEIENYDGVVVDGVHEGPVNTKASTLYLLVGKNAAVNRVTATDRNKKLVVKKKVE